MRIFMYELKKLWNWRILLAIAVLIVLTWFAILAEGIRSYDSLKHHGAYGSFQTEMFRLYGDTLEPDELADFDIPGKVAEAILEMDALIANDPVFAEYGISNFEEYWTFYNSSYHSEILGDDIFGSKEDNDFDYMNKVLNHYAPDNTLEDWYASPMVRLDCLQALAGRYMENEYWVDGYIEGDSRSVVVRAAEELKATGNNSLINDYLLTEFTLYAATAGVASLLAVILLVMPLLIIDRSWGINLLQYSSAMGRKIFKIQFAAVIASAFILSAILTAVLFAPFIVLASEYWNTGIMSSGHRGIWLYDITFGQYVFSLAGLITAFSVGAASVVFLLARFSANIINATIKAVPVSAALSALSAFTVFMAFHENNVVFNHVFHGRVQIPEVMFGATVVIIGTAAAALVVKREKRVDVA